MDEDNKKMIEYAQRLEKLFLTIFEDDNIGKDDVEMSILRINTLNNEIKDFITGYFFGKIQNDEILFPESYEYVILYIKNSKEEYEENYDCFLKILLKLLNSDKEVFPYYYSSIIETYMGILKYLVEYNDSYDDEIKDYVLKLKESIAQKENDNLVIWVNSLIIDIKLPLEKNKMYKPIEVFNKEEHEELCDIFMIEDCKDSYNFTGCSNDPEYIEILQDSNNLTLGDFETQADLMMRLGELSNKYKRLKGQNYRPLHAIAWDIFDELDVKVKTSPKLRYYLTKMSDLYSLNDKCSGDYSPIEIVNYVIFYMEDYFKSDKLEKLLYELKCISYGFYNEDEENDIDNSYDEES